MHTRQSKYFKNFIQAKPKLLKIWMRSLENHGVTFIQSTACFATGPQPLPKRVHTPCDL